jgi:hypothetical protein
MMPALALDYDTGAETGHWTTMSSPTLDDGSMMLVLE